MIKKIYIGNIATYIPGVEFEPKKLISFMELMVLESLHYQKF